MIPKKIHYCWFGKSSLPIIALKCIASWKKHMPEYEIIEWNEDNFDVNQFTFTKEAYISKKYAFVSDVCRLYVLHNEGGIYLDTDMEILKPLDCITNNLVIGFEEKKFIAAGIIISPSNHNFIKSIVEIYKTLSFSQYASNLKEVTIPKIITKELVTKGLILDNKNQVIDQTISIFSSDYFYPLNYFTGELIITEKTYSIHHYESSWMTSREKTINRVKTILISIFGLNFFTKITQVIKRNEG